MSVLDRVLAEARPPVLLVGSDVTPGGDADVQVVAPGVVLARQQRFATVVLVADDVADLRRAASLCGGLRRARTVVVLVGDGVRGVLSPVVHPAWPQITGLTGWREDGVAVTRVTFAGRAEVSSVVAALADATAPGVPRGPAGLRLAFPSLPDGVTAVPPLDPAVVADVGTRPDRPPDVVVGDPPGPVPVSAVTGRAPVVLAPEEVGSPVDEAVFNPRGFTRRTTRGVVDLPPATRPDSALIRSLRDARAVRVPPGADPVVVAALAMSGVPLLREGPDGSDGPDVTDLADDEARERYSVAQRRAALLEHSTVAWRTRLAARAGVRVATWPTVSVVVDPAAGETAAEAVARGRRQAVGVPGVEVEVVASGTSEPTGDLLLHLGPDDDPPPDLLTDLLLARRYSGARTVGRPPRVRDAETWGTAAVAPLLVDRHGAAGPGAPVYRIHAVSGAGA